MTPYRILSLDGGGTWALIQVMALQKIYGEHTKGHEVLKDFDLVAANSGGSITAGGLVTNLPLSEILGYFCDKKKRDQIFNPLPFALEGGEEGQKRPFRYLFNRFVRRILPLGAKYGTREKRRGLEQVLTTGKDIYEAPEGKKITSPDYSLEDIPGMIERSIGRSPHFLICGFKYDKKRAKFFRSNPASLASGKRKETREEDREATLIDAIHASTNAPVNYFVCPAQIKKSQYWDGAIAGLNNPVLAAVTEALANGVETSAIRVLSIGTGTISLPYKEGNEADDKDLLLSPATSTLFGDVAQLSTSILDDPPDNATFISHIVLSPGGLVGDDSSAVKERPIVRMTPVVRPTRKADRKWGLPNGFTKTEFMGLVKLDLDATTDEEIGLLRKLAEAWFAGDIPNQAIREGDDYKAQLGHDTFAGALQHWRAIMAASTETPMRSMSA